jgi:hypothetical protein
MYRLRKKRPPFGTAETPIWEHAYSEEVKVVDGLCEVKNEATRDYLLKMGYDEIQVEEPETNGKEEKMAKPRSKGKSGKGGR